MITASGICVTLLAASGGAFTRAPAAVPYVKLAILCLVLCVVFSMGTMLALVRCHELANTRWTIQARQEGRVADIQIPQGALSNGELGLILMFAFVALVTFLAGFVFLGIIGWHY
jgi:hypothetical protein